MVGRAPPLRFLMKETHPEQSQGPALTDSERLALTSLLATNHPDWTRERVDVAVSRIEHRQRGIDELISVWWVLNRRYFRNLKRRNPLLFKDHLKSEERKRAKKLYPHLDWDK